MRKKQFLALFLTGALTVGMAPSAVFAAEDSTTISIEGENSTVDGETGETPGTEGETTTPGENSGNEGEVVPTPEQPQPTEPIPPETTPTETPNSEAPTQTPSQTPTQAPEEEQKPEQLKEEEETADPKAEGAITLNGTVYSTLKEAVQAATGGTIEAPSEILISGAVTVDETIEISSGQVIRMIAQTAGTSIKRGDGLTASMFLVNGGTLDFCTAVPTEGADTAAADMTVNGMISSGDATEGAIVEVASGTFVLENGVTLTGNTSSKEGGAVRAATGSQISLAGGSITGNSATEGAGIYSEGTIALKGTVQVSGNQVYGGTEENNIALKGAGVITVGGKVENSAIGVKFLEGKEGTPVITLAEGVTEVTLAEVLPQITYNGTDFMIDENGLLKSNSVAPTPTPEEEPLKLTGKSMEWTGPNSAKVVAVSNRDGWYYADWVVAGEKAPTFDLEKEGVPVQKDRAFTIYFTELDSQHDIDIYVRVKDKNDNLSKKLLFQLKRKEVTPTPPQRDPIVPKVTESVVQGLENPLEFYPNTFYPFTVIGAGTTIEKPVKGDVKWVPLYWSTSSNPSDSQKQATWKIGATNGIRDAATYDLYVFFQKYEHDGTDWQQTDVIESASYKFKSKAIEFNNATPTPLPGQQGGNGEYYDPESGDPQSQTVDGDVTGATSTSDTVATGDETPIAVMMMLATVSLLAGGYVLVRKRKKEN